MPAPPERRDEPCDDGGRARPHLELDPQEPTLPSAHDDARAIERELGDDASVVPNREGLAPRPQSEQATKRRGPDRPPNPHAHLTSSHRERARPPVAKERRDLPAYRHGAPPARARLHGRLDRHARPPHAERVPAAPEPPIGGIEVRVAQVNDRCRRHGPAVELRPDEPSTKRRQVRESCHSSRRCRLLKRASASLLPLSLVRRSSAASAFSVALLA